MKKPNQFIRNFCIIAHIDHGKSTLADRIMELTGQVSEREMEDQLISDEDVKECIFTAQESGGGFVQEDGTRLGMLVREVLTYWVEYRPADGENTFDVHTAYVHRMRLGEEEEDHG